MEKVIKNDMGVYGVNTLTVVDAICSHKNHAYICVRNDSPLGTANSSSIGLNSEQTLEVIEVLVNSLPDNQKAILLAAMIKAKK